MYLTYMPWGEFVITGSEYGYSTSHYPTHDETRYLFIWQGTINAIIYSQLEIVLLNGGFVALAIGQYMLKAIY